MLSFWLCLSAVFPSLCFYKVLIVSPAGQMNIMRNFQRALDMSGYVFVCCAGIYDDASRLQELAKTFLHLCWDDGATKNKSHKEVRVFRVFVLVRKSFYLVRGSLYLSKKNYSMFRADVTVMFQQACCELQQPGTRLHLSPVVMLIQEMDRK